MRPRFWIAILAGIVLGIGTAAAAPPAPVDMGIITGSEKGTYYQFGLNLKRLVSQHGINLTVATSKGSVENIFAVYQRSATQLGIVQSDVLAFVARVETDPGLKRIAKKIKMVFPLYNEEIHILGRKNIADFDELADKRVAIGREGSGTYLTARLLFKVAEVEPRQMVTIDTDEALTELKAGRIDAMFYVAGAPVKLFAEGVTAADNLTLIPVTNKSIIEFYPTAEIPANTYGWQPRPLPRSPSSQSSCPSTSAGSIAITSAASPSSSPRTWAGSGTTVTSSGSRFSSTIRSRAGISTTACESMSGVQPLRPPRNLRRILSWTP